MTDYSAIELKNIIICNSIAIKNQVRSQALWANSPSGHVAAAAGRKIRVLETRLHEAIEELAKRSSDV